MGGVRIPGEHGRQSGPLRFLSHASGDRDPRGGDVLPRPVRREPLPRFPPRDDRNSRADRQLREAEHHRSREEIAIWHHSLHHTI
jgi:hypothetical protein